MKLSLRLCADSRRSIKQWTKYIRDLGKQQQWPQALCALEEMQECGVFPDALTQTAAVNACAEGRSWGRALHLFFGIEGPDQVAHRAAIKACERGRKWRCALHLLTHMRSQSMEVGLSTVNSAISACEKAGQWAWALQLLADLQSSASRPDVVTFSALISACEKGGQWTARGAAAPGGDERRARGGQRHHLQRAHQRLRKGRGPLEAGAGAAARHDGGLAPNIISYNAAISACEKGEQWPRALRLLGELRERRLQPTGVTCGALMAACEKGGRWQEASHLFAEMGLLPNIIMCSALISACEKGGRWEHALQWLAEARARELQPDLIAFNACISACEKGEQWRRGLQLLEELQSSGLLPDIITHNALISACGRAQRWEQACLLLQELRSSDLEPNAVTHAASMLACAGEPEAWLRLQDGLLADGVPLDSFMCGHVLAECEEQKYLDREVSVLTSASERLGLGPAGRWTATMRLLVAGRTVDLRERDGWCVEPNLLAAAGLARA